MGQWRTLALSIWIFLFLSCVLMGALVIISGVYGRPINPYWHRPRVVVDYVGETGHFGESFMPVFGPIVVLLVVTTLAMLVLVPALRGRAGGFMLAVCLCASALWWIAQFLIIG